MRKVILLVPAVLTLVLAACSAPPPTDEEKPSRYSQANDGAPPRSIGPEDVADAVPRADPILAAGNKSPYTINGVTYEVLESARNYEEEGIASYAHVCVLEVMWRAAWSSYVRGVRRMCVCERTIK